MRNILLGLLVLFSSTTAFAQEDSKVPFKDRLVPRFGYILSFLNTTDTFTFNPGSFNYSFNTVQASSYIMLAQHNDWVSVGADAGLGFGLNFGANNRLNWQVQVPIMLMGRIGAVSTAYNSQRVGIGLGIGGTTTYMNFQNGFIEQKDLWFHPTAAAEINIGTNSGPITVRGTMSLGSANGTGNALTNTGNISYPLETGGPIRGRLFTIGLQYGL